jgi:hypothetical protein
MADQYVNGGPGSLAERMIDMGDQSYAKQVVQAHGYYSLLKGLAAIAPGAMVGPVAGGDYLWRTEAANWNGSTATLQYLGLDGATWFPVLKSDGATSVTLTANGSVAVGIAQGSVIRVNVTGAAPTGMNSAIGGL